MARLKRAIFRYCTYFAVWAAVFLCCDSATARDTISLDAAIADAITASYDVQIAKAKASQYHADIRAAKADYYPTLTLTASTEFDQGLKQSAQPVFSVGNATFNAITRFQELASLQTSWLLNDFGARANNVKAAKFMYLAARTNAQTIIRDLQLQVIDAYSQALAAYRALRAKEESRSVYSQLFAIKKSTYQSGAISRVELGEQALQLAQAEDTLRELRKNFVDRLRDLTTLTHKVYAADEIELEDFAELPTSAFTFERQSTADYIMFDQQINSKKAELKALAAQRFPQIRLYGGYLFYGTDRNNLGAAFGSFSHRMADIGVTVQWPIFDGFKNAAQRERKRAEIRELELTRDKKLCELQYQYDTAHTLLRPLTAQLSTKAEVINKERQKIDIYRRLAEQKVADPAQELTQKAQLIEQQLAADKVRIEKAAATQKLRVLAGM